MARAAKIMQDDREEILRRLQPPLPSPLSPAAAPPPMPTAQGDLIAAFAAAAAANQSQVQVISSIALLPQAVAAFLEQHAAAPQVLCESEFLSPAWAAAGIDAQHRAPQADDLCGVTGVGAAAANNGMLLLADDVPHRLTLSLLPPYYVAVVAADKIVADLPALWQRLPRPLPRRCVLAGGPSRTADIEQTLTLGAHGPVSVLTVVVRGNAD